MQSKPDTPDGSPCYRALRTLAEARLRDFQGLPAGCARRDAEAAFGPTEAGPDGSGSLGGQLTAYRIYPPQPVAPHGLIVWYAGDIIVAVEISEPRLEPTPESLGAPEATAPSRLFTRYIQWIYATRGLALHVDKLASVDILRAYAFQPTTVDAFLQSPLARVESRRVRLRP